MNTKSIIVGIAIGAIITAAGIIGYRFYQLTGVVIQTRSDVNQIIQIIQKNSQTEPK